jgi:hypothetical protein
MRKGTQTSVVISKRQFRRTISPIRAMGIGPDVPHHRAWRTNSIRQRPPQVTPNFCRSSPMGKWYVSYKAGCAMVMKIVPNRANAIEVAYKFLGQNVDVHELGPLSEHRDGNVVSAATLRDLYKASNLR